MSTTPIFSWEEYQQLACRTLARGPDERRILCLGLIGESGELCDLTKKIFGHGHPEDREAVTKEIGDVLWYAATLSYVMGWDFAYGGWLFDYAPGADKIDLAVRVSKFATQAAVAVVEEPNAMHDVLDGENKARTALHLMLQNLGALADSWGIYLHLAAGANIAKLQARYPEGFSTERSINR